MLAPADARERLAAVTRTALLDTPPEEAFDRLTRMAARLLGAPVSLITLVTEDRQFFKSATGLPEPWASRRGSPLSHLVLPPRGRLGPCRWSSRTPAGIRCSGATPRCGSSGWIAYAGVPLVTGEGYVLGAFSVADGMPRLWSDRDVALLQDFAACAASEIELRTLKAREQSAKAPVNNGGPRPPDVFEDTGIPMGWLHPRGRWTRVNRALCELLGYREDELLGAPSEGIIHPDDRPIQREAVRLLLAGECPSYTSEHRCTPAGRRDRLGTGHGDPGRRCGSPPAPLRLRHPGHQRPQARRDRAARERGALPAGGTGHPQRGLGLGPRHQPRGVERGAGDAARPRPADLTPLPPGGTSTSTAKTASGSSPESRARSAGASAPGSRSIASAGGRDLRPRGRPQLCRHRPVGRAGARGRRHGGCEPRPGGRGRAPVGHRGAPARRVAGRRAEPAAGADRLGGGPRGRSWTASSVSPRSTAAGSAHRSCCWIRAGSSSGWRALPRFRPST